MDDVHYLRLLDDPNAFEELKENNLVLIESWDFEVCFYSL